MKLTTEQQSIINYVSSPNAPLTLVDSVAGSGKTSLLVAITNKIPHTNGLYMAYNNSVAKEAKTKFPTTTHCMTTHSMAYQAVVKNCKPNLGTFNYKSITDKISYDNKCSLLDHIRSFCLSKHVIFDNYAATTSMPSYFPQLANKYLGLMESGKIECSHEFYLKLFHIQLHQNLLEYDPFDFIMLDEAGDLNEVTLAIFQLLPSKKKIAVGDKHQNIYQFNETINCFMALEDQGKSFKMTQSFRVAKPIAKRIQTFCRNYLDPDMTFKGVNIKDPTIYTRAYLARTNAALVKRMIECNQDNIPYGLLRRAQDIFRLPLTLCNLKHKSFIADPAYKHLQNDVNDWYEDEAIRKQHKSPLSYIANLYKEDVALTQATKLVRAYTPKVVIDTYQQAFKHQKANQSYTLATVHSCKGSEFDEVTIADDLNESIIRTVESTASIENLLPKEVESLNLYYVACSRARVSLLNAAHL